MENPKWKWNRILFPVFILSFYFDFISDSDRSEENLGSEQDINKRWSDSRLIYWGLKKKAKKKKRKWMELESKQERKFDFKGIEDRVQINYPLRSS